MTVKMWTSSNTRSAHSGYSLIELLIVLSIIGLMTSLASTSMIRAQPGAFLDRQAAILAGDLKLSRTTALALSEPVIATLFTDGYEISKLNIRRTWPEALAAELETSDQDQIIFEPNGSSTGGAIHLTYKAQTASVSVSPLTGLVAIDE